MDASDDDLPFGLSAKAFSKTWYYSESFDYGEETSKQRVRRAVQNPGVERRHDYEMTEEQNDLAFKKKWGLS